MLTPPTPRARAHTHTLYRNDRYARLRKESGHGQQLHWRNVQPVFSFEGVCVDAVVGVHCEHEFVDRTENLLNSVVHGPLVYQWDAVMDRMS